MIPHLSTPDMPPPLPHTPTPPHLHPALSFNMVNTKNMLLFNGLRTIDGKPFWFAVYVVWKEQQITDDNMKKP